MDLNKNGEAEDRISELPDSILHYILSFLETECVAQTAVLSKRWKYLWTSIPTLVFPYWNQFSYSLSETNTFMEFVDRTLLFHDASSNIQKFHLTTNEHMSVSRVHSWIKYLTMHNVEELNLWFDEHKRFLIPLSLFTCESLTTLEITAPPFIPIHLPKSFSLPKLKSLTLHGIGFIDEQHISNCPVLENLILDFCTWFGVTNFCISTPALKLLQIDNGSCNDNDGLQDCALKINAPNLVSFIYHGWVAKEYFISSFQKLESASIQLCDEYDVPRGRKIGAAVSKFFQALAHVKKLTVDAETLQTISVVDEFVNILPTFHNLEKLFLELEVTTDKSVFPMLKAAPNLTHLVFNEGIHDSVEDDNWDGAELIARYLFEHLQSVCFMCFNGNAREMRWLKLILRNAKALRTVTVGSYIYPISAKNKQVLMLEFPSLPKASGRCVLEFH